MKNNGAITQKDAKIKELEEKKISYLIKKAELEEECQKLLAEIEAKKSKKSDAISQLDELLLRKANTNHKLKLLLVLLISSGIISFFVSSLFPFGVGFAFTIFQGIKPIVVLKECKNSEADLLIVQKAIDRDFQDLTYRKDQITVQINLVNLSLYDIDVERSVVESIRETILKENEDEQLEVASIPRLASDKALTRINPNLFFQS